MSSQIVMDHSGDSRHQFGPNDAEAVASRDRQGQERLPAIRDRRQSRKRQKSITSGNCPQERARARLPAAIGVGHSVPMASKRTFNLPGFAWAGSFFGAWLSEGQSSSAA